MTLKRKLSLDDLKTSREIAIENKETVNAKPKKLKRLSRAKCGIENPCVFGKHSESFEFKISKRKSL